MTLEALKIIQGNIECPFCMERLQAREYQNGMRAMCPDCSFTGNYSSSGFFVEIVFRVRK